MKKVSVVLLLIVSFIWIGCSSHDVSRGVEDSMANVAGNKPAKFFNFTEPKYVDRWKFRHKDYEALSPFTKVSDWSEMSGWDGGYFGNSIAIGLRQGRNGNYNGISYALDIHSSILKYTDIERAIENNNIDYIRKGYHKYNPKTKVHIEHHGRENYSCVVINTQDEKQGLQRKIYNCYKFNPARTIAKRVKIILVYSKTPNLPAKYKNLAKQYTYQDLQKRAKRVLDSLYIKDGWEE